MIFSDNSLLWLENLLTERFGHAFTLCKQADALLLTLAGNESCIRFDQLQKIFHKSHSSFPCNHWQASSEGYTSPIEDILPAPSEVELPSPLIELTDNGATFHYDILGLTYWMLTRLEEVGSADLDEHGRFPAISSHAYKHNYLERPIVDEWLNILGQVIQRVWPDIGLKRHQFGMKVSHDVDHPARYGFANPKRLLRAMVGDIVKRKEYKNAMLAPWIRLNTRHKLHPRDPYNTFDWIMNQSEQHGLKSAFYFMCGRTDIIKDGDYEIEHPAIVDLMQRIHKRGHEIGLHPSYGTYQQPELIKNEAEHLKRVCAEVVIEQQQWGGRMHYLRWEQPTTLRAWADAGMGYDSTLGYADRPGFRCGTCHEYPVFDPVAKEQLFLRVRPLVVMECSVMAEKYLGLGATELALEKILEIKNRCITVSGCFTLLWHNSEFQKSTVCEIYQQVLGS